MRISADWLAAPETQAVCAMLLAGGRQALFVGGCVRNALMGRPVADIDIATDARPDQVMVLAEAAGLKPVPTGVAHGTVTVVAGNRPFEVTTFRRDVETDGRRAKVAFTDEIAEDAARRDFTMNALYARPDGVVVDPLGGLGKRHHLVGPRVGGDVDVGDRATHQRVAHAAADEERLAPAGEEHGTHRLGLRRGEPVGRDPHGVCIRSDSVFSIRAVAPQM